MERYCWKSSFTLFQMSHKCGCKVLNLVMLIVLSVLGEAWTDALPVPVSCSQMKWQ